MSSKRLAPRTNALRVVMIQALIVLIVAISLVVLRNANMGFSFLAGGFTSIIPNFIFAFRLFSETGARAAKRIIKRFYLGELIKLLLIGLFFIASMRLLKVNFTPFLLGLVIAQFGIMVAPMFFLLRRGEDF